MACGLPPDQSFWLWVGPVVAVVILLLALSWLLLAYRTRMQNDWTILRTNRLKRRLIVSCSRCHNSLLALL